MRSRITYMNMVRNFLLVFFGIGIISSCVFVNHKKQFEDPKSASVGIKVEQTVYRHPHWIREVRRGVMEYGFKDSFGCSWAIDVDERTKVILGWRYLSEESLCWRHFPTA